MKRSFALIALFALLLSSLSMFALAEDITPLGINCDCGKGSFEYYRTVRSPGIWTSDTCPHNDPTHTAQSRAVSVKVQDKCSYCGTIIITDSYTEYEYRCINH